MCIVDDVMFVNPHFVGIAMRTYFTISADLLVYSMGPFAKTDEQSSKEYKMPYLAHYVTKSREECFERRSRVRADTPTPRDNIDEFF